MRASPAKMAGALVVAELMVAGPALAQVYRCTVDGKPVYQQAPCAAVGGVGAAIKIYAAAPTAPPPPASAVQALAKPAPPAQAPAPQPTPAPAEPAPRADIDIKADMCLDWYRPMLRDPRGAYWRDAHTVQGVVNITVVATNGFGGFVNTPAACEFRQGSIDEGWTKTQAKRRHWAVN